APPARAAAEAAAAPVQQLAARAAPEVEAVTAARAAPLGEEATRPLTQQETDFLRAAAQEQVGRARAAGVLAEQAPATPAVFVQTDVGNAARLVERTEAAPRAERLLAAETPALPRAQHARGRAGRR